jgi:hypothetical protein
VISNKQREFKYVTTDEGSNNQTFLQLLEEVKDWAIDAEKTVLIMDNGK